MRRGVFALCLLLAALPGRPAAAQDDDPGILARFLQDNLSAAGREVRITGFRGALSSLAQIDRITVADDAGIWLTLEGVALDWNRAALLRGRLEVNRLTARDIVMARQPEAETAAPSPEARGFALPDLPVSVSVGEISATRVELAAPVLGEPLTASASASLTLAGGEGDTNLLLTRTDDGPAMSIALQAGYANASRSLVVNLDAREAAGGVAARLLGLPGTPATELTVKGEGLIDDFTAAVRLATDGTDRLAGTVELLAAPDGGQAFAATFGGNPAPLFLPAYADFFGTSVALDLAGQRAATGAFDLSRLSVRTDALSLEGTLRLASDMLPEALRLTGKIAHADGRPVLLPVPGQDRILVDRADVTLGFDATQDEGWTALVSLSGLDQPQIRIGQALLSGSGRIARGPQGNLAGGTVRLLAAGLAPADPALAQALGTGLTATSRIVWQEGQPVEISDLTLAGSDFTATARAQVEGLAAGLRLAGRAGLEAADLARFSGLAGRPLGGAARIEASGSGSTLAGDFDVEATVQGDGLRIGQAEADRLLAGRTALVIKAARGPEGTDIRQLDLTAATLALRAQGQLRSAGSTVTADLDFADLAVLGPAWGGALTARAELSGTLDAGRLTLDGQGRDLAVGQPAADGLLRGTSRLSVALRREAGAILVERATLSSPQAEADVSGRLQADRSDLSGRVTLNDLSPVGPGLSGRLAATGRVTGTPENGSLTLDATASNLAVGQPQADRLLAGASTLGLSLRTEGGAIRVDRARLANPQLSLEATGQATGGTRSVTLTGRLGDLALLLPEFPGPVTLSGSATDDGTGYRVDVTGRGPGQIDARATGVVASTLARADLTLSGTAQAALANAFIAPQTVEGPLRFDLRLNGPFALPSLSGRVTLSDGRLAIPAAPFSLQAIAAQADLAAGSARLAVTAGVSSGGSVALSGPVALTPPFAGDLTLDLRDVILRDPDLYEVRTQGQLRLTGPLSGGARISGTVNIPNAELRVPSTGIGGAGAIPDLRHVNEPAAVRITRDRAGLIETGRDRQGGGLSRPYVLDVRVNAPSQIYLRGRGLDAELGGALQIGGTSTAVAPSGEIRLIRGRLDILGRRLDLTEAQISLGGSLDAVLRIVASNTSDGITSSVVIAGPVSDPQVSFSSVPSLPDEEVLARLLFGRDLSSLSAFQAAQLASAVATLAGRGGEGLIATLRKGFGLDDLDIVTDGDGDASVRLGKYVARNIYSEVVVSGGTSQLNLNLDIRPGVTARATAGTDGQTGIGIFVDRDY